MCPYQCQYEHSWMSCSCWCFQSYCSHKLIEGLKNTEDQRALQLCWSHQSPSCAHSFSFPCSGINMEHTCILHRKNRDVGDIQCHYLHTYKSYQGDFRIKYYLWCLSSLYILFHRLFGRRQLNYTLQMLDGHFGCLGPIPFVLLDSNTKG